MVQQVSASFLRTVADAVPSLIAYWERDLRCGFANRLYSDWFGLPIDSIIGMEMRSLLGEHLFSLNVPHIEAVLAGEDQQFERVVTKTDGTVAHVWVSYVPHRDERQAICGFFVLVTDVTPLRLSDRRVEESESRYRLLADHSSDMIFQLDRDLVRRYVSPACREILGYEPHELIGVKPVSQVHPDDADRVAGVFRSLLDGSVERSSVTNRIRHRDGRWVWVEVEFRAIRDPGTGERSGIIGAMRDISLRKSIEAQLAEANQQLENLARLDGLTGLANRRSFDEALTRDFWRARHAGKNFSVVMIDVDRFKLFNDQYGHPEGDECLKRVSARIVASVRNPNDLAARYGGEEFAVLLPETDAVGATTVAERIRTSVESLALEHKAIPSGIVTISAGVSGISEYQDSPVSLLQAADRALYRAKAAGRNVVVRSAPEPQQVDAA